MCMGCFNINLACKVGMKAAVLHQFFTTELIYARALNCNKHTRLENNDEYRCYNGVYMVRISIDNLHKRIPYLTKADITKAIKKLIDAGYLQAGNFSDDGFNRTKWYSLTDKEE